MNLGGKTALVTGASRGIGRAIALSLAAAQANVAVNYANNAEAAQEVVKEIEAYGVKALAFQADVSRESEVSAMVAHVSENLGGVDILVNNAGINRDSLLMRMRDEDWEKVLQTNLKGTFLTTRSVLRHMLKARYGRVINISSVIGLRGNAGQANYAAAKAGLIGFTKSLAREVGTRNITANVITPGFIKTEMTKKLPEKVQEQVLSEIPQGRFGEPEDVGALVAFLAGETAGYITGQVISVDGGMAI